MKNIFLSTVAAVFCGALSVSALDAAKVEVSLGKGLTRLDIEPISAPGGATISLAGKKDKSKSTKLSWQVINVPVDVRAGKLKAGEPDFVPAITFTVHVLMEAKVPGVKGSKALLSKTLTYHDIPVGSVQGGVGTDMCVSVLLSPRSVSKLTVDKTGRLGKVLAVAVEAADHTGANCFSSSSKESNNVVFDATLGVNGKWWATKKVGDAGAELLAVNETPFAYWMPPTSPRVTTEAAVGTAPTGPSTYTPTLPEDEATETTPTGGTGTPTATDTEEDGADSTATEQGSSRGKTRTRGKSRRSRN